MRKTQLVSSLGASALIAIACKASFELKDNSLVGDATIKVEVDPRSSTAEVPPDPPRLPPGACIKLTFLDESGNPMGSIETTAGSGPFPFPSGAKGAEVGPCDEEDKEPKDKAKRSELRTTERSPGDAPQRYSFQYMPLDVLDGEATLVSYSVLASSLSEARLISRQFVRRLFSAPAPKGLDTWTAYESILLPDSSVQLTFFSEAAPQDLTVHWNGQFIADLSGAVVENRDGWFRTTVLVPASVVDGSLTGTSTNALSYSLLADGMDVGGDSTVVVDPL